jgi:hypothetical protein
VKARFKITILFVIGLKALLIQLGLKIHWASVYFGASRIRLVQTGVRGVLDLRLEFVKKNVV